MDRNGSTGGAIALCLLVFLLCFTPREAAADPRRAVVGVIPVRFVDGVAHTVVLRQPDSDKWELPRGGLPRRLRDAPLEGAFKELQEETGIRREQVTLLGAEPIRVGEAETGATFYLGLTTATEITIREGEHEKGKWMPLAEAVPILKKRDRKGLKKAIDRLARSPRAAVERMRSLRGDERAARSERATTRRARGAAGLLGDALEGREAPWTGRLRGRTTTRRARR